MNNLVVSNLSKTYGNKIALMDFSFQLSGGKLVGLIGRNGAGKTTLLNCLAGFIRPNKGNMTLDGIDLQNVRNETGIAIDTSFVEYLSGEDNLKLLEYTSGKRSSEQSFMLISKLLQLVDLSTARKKKVSEYSYGMKQRLGFVQAILNGSKLLILDEPFAGLDINGRQIVKDYLREVVKNKNIAVLFSDHNLEEVKDICDHIICIKDGIKVYDGPVSDDTIYYIQVNMISNKLISSLEKFDLSYDLSEKLIFLQNEKNIDAVLRIMLQHTKIYKINSVEDSLKHFLKGAQ